MNGHINASLILLDRAIEGLENGFVACERCGDQEETKDLDCIVDLKDAKKELESFAAKDQTAPSKREQLLAQLRETEKLAHEYFSDCDLGQERIAAYEIYENVRTATRVG